MSSVNITRYLPSGEIESTGSVPQAMLSAQSGLFIQGSYDSESYYMVGDTPVLKTARPSLVHTFDYATGVWQVQLSDLKTAKWVEIKAARNAAEYGTFMWGAVELDCDEESRARITGGTVLALLDPAFTTNWTAADNSVWPITATQMMQIGGDLGLHTDALHATASALRAQIDAATTEAELTAIVWP